MTRSRRLSTRGKIEGVQASLGVLAALLVAHEMLARGEFTLAWAGLWGLIGAYSLDRMLTVSGAWREFALRWSPPTRGVYLSVRPARERPAAGGLGPWIERRPSGVRGRLVETTVYLPALADGALPARMRVRTMSRPGRPSERTICTVLRGAEFLEPGEAERNLSAWAALRRSHALRSPAGLACHAVVRARRALDARAVEYERLLAEPPETGWADHARA